METNDTDAWDNICVNPHEAAVEIGRNQGRQDGSHAGLEEGYALGRTTAVEYGMEVGFVRGVALALEQHDEQAERVQKNLQELQRALDDFPSSDEVFRREKNIFLPGAMTIHQPGNSNDHHDESRQMQSSHDIEQKMQRIRARFKLLIVQLGMPHYSLQQLMDDARESELASSTAHQETYEW
jgi:hypothetical protein